MLHIQKFALSVTRQACDRSLGLTGSRHLYPKVTIWMPCVIESACCKCLSQIFAAASDWVLRHPNTQKGMYNGLTFCPELHAIYIFFDLDIARLRFCIVSVSSRSGGAFLFPLRIPPDSSWSWNKQLMALELDSGPRLQQIPCPGIFCKRGPELAELVDDGGFVLQGVRMATWKSSSSWHVTWNPSNLSLAWQSTPSQT